MMVGLVDLDSRGVVIAGRAASIGIDDLDIVERAIGMRTRDLREVAGSVEVLVRGRVGLARDVVAVVVVALIGVGDIGRRLHAVGVDRRRVRSVGVLNYLIGKDSRRVIPV